MRRKGKKVMRMRERLVGLLMTMTMTVQRFAVAVAVPLSNVRGN
jgi:hypothetical protein